MPVSGRTEDWLTQQGWMVAEALGLLTSGDFRKLVEGWHGLQFIGVHLGCPSL